MGHPPHQLLVLVKLLKICFLFQHIDELLTRTNSEIFSDLHVLLVNDTMLSILHKTIPIVKAPVQLVAHILMG